MFRNAPMRLREQMVDLRIEDRLSYDEANTVYMNYAALQGPQLTAEVKVADLHQFKRIKKGDQVYATYTQALAMVVEPAPKK